MRWKIWLVALAALTAAACEDGRPVPIGPDDQLAIAGTYAASIGEGEEFGAILFRADTASISRDMIAEGAALVLGLHPNGALSGRLFIPANFEGVPDLDVDLTGTWRLDDGVVVLDPGAGTFLRDLSFEIEADRLVADDLVGGVRVRLELERVTGEQGTDSDPVPGPAGFEVTGDLAVFESFPLQLVGSLTFRNISGETLALQTDVCWPLLRAYRPGEDQPVWDQLEEGACNLFTPREDIVEPGRSVRFESPIVSGAGVLDDELPDGTYEMRVYFLVLGEGEIEVPVGEVELAIVR